MGERGFCLGEIIIEEGSNEIVNFIGMDYEVLWILTVEMLWQYVTTWDFLKFLKTKTLDF